MAKKPNKPTPQSTVITVILPDSEEAERTGQIVVKRGTLARISQFSYGSLDDIMAAIQASAEDLIALEQNPPPKLPPAGIAPTPARTSTPPATTQAKAAADEQAEDEPDAEDPVAEETSTDPEEAATEEIPNPVPTAKQQPTLF